MALTPKRGRGRRLTPKQQMELLGILQNAFHRELARIRAEQRRLVAQITERMDREKSEQLLKSLKD